MDVLHGVLHRVLRVGRTPSANSGRRSRRQLWQLREQVRMSETLLPPAGGFGHLPICRRRQTDSAINNDTSSLGDNQ